MVKCAGIMIPVTATFPEENSHKELPGKEPNGKGGEIHGDFQ